MTDTKLDDAIARVIQSASRLGVEINVIEAQRWIHEMANEQSGGDVVVDVDSGVFGHRASMLDLDPNDLKRFKQIAKIVGFENRENVRTALALSGSSAQSRIQAYPADADFFERIHITAPTREEACRILGEIMRDKALSTLSGPNSPTVGSEAWHVGGGDHQGRQGPAPRQSDLMDAERDSRGRDRGDGR